MKSESDLVHFLSLFKAKCIGKLPYYRFGKNWGSTPLKSLFKVTPVTGYVECWHAGRSIRTERFYLELSSGRIEGSFGSGFSRERRRCHIFLAFKTTPKMIQIRDTHRHFSIRMVQKRKMLNSFVPRKHF